MGWRHRLGQALKEVQGLWLGQAVGDKGARDRGEGRGRGAWCGGSDGMRGWNGKRGSEGRVGWENSED